MVFAINPTAEKTFDQFKANALAAAPPAAGAASSAIPLGGGLGAGNSGSKPTEADITLTSAPTAVTPEGTAAALQNSAALSSVVGWKMVAGSVLLGALVL